MTLNPLLCFGETPSFWIFDFSVAPYLLYYSYIPTIILSLLIGFFVLTRDNYSLKSRMFFFLIISFVLWVVNIIFEWLVSYIVLLMFSWQLIILFEIPIFIFAVLFTYTFLNKTEKLPNSYKIGSLLVYLLTALVVPTLYNMGDFNISVCEGAYGAVWNYVYGLEIFSIGFIVYLCLKNYFSKTSEIAKKQVLYYMSGMICFLAIFIFSNVFAEISDNYQMNFFGPLGMTIFLALLTYLIVRYQAFNIKLIGAQALVWSLAILIGSQLFFIEKTSNFILTGITLSLSIIFGGLLIQSVKREIEQSIRLKKLTEDLATTNKGQENLIHIMNHQIKGYIGTAKNIFSELGESQTYGKMPEKAKPLLVMGLKKMNEGVDYIQTILKGESAQSGTLPYTMEVMDLKGLIENLVSEQKTIAEEKGLSLDSKLEDGDYNMTGDVTLLTESFKNLITNSIKYTETGSIFVAMSRSEQKILWSVKDTGRGISAEDGARLFTPGGMGKDSLKYNIEASGYGLAFVKPVVEKHNGRIWYESEVGKGSTFYVELPVV